MFDVSFCGLSFQGVYIYIYIVYSAWAGQTHINKTSSSPNLGRCVHWLPMDTPKSLPCLTQNLSSLWMVLVRGPSVCLKTLWVNRDCRELSETDNDPPRFPGGISLTGWDAPGFLRTDHWLVVTGTCSIFPYIGNSSSQLTFIFFRGVETTNQINIQQRALYKFL